MKKIALTIAMAALVIFAGCKKNQETGGTRLTAGIEQHKSDSKTSLNPDDLSISWTEGDKIMVNNGSEPKEFTLSSVDGEGRGVFECTGDYSFGATNVAVYPYDENTSVSGTTVTMTLPAEQTSATGTFGNGANPMLATFENPEDITFTSLCGALCLQLTGEASITAIEIVAASSDVKLNGTFTVADYTATAPALTYSEGGSNSVRLNCTTTLTADAQKFFVVLPACTMTGGFTLNVYNGENVVFSKSTTNDIEIEKNKVTTMNEFAVVIPALTVTTISPTHISTTTALGIGSVSGGTPFECGVVYALASDLSDPATDLVLNGTGVSNMTATTATTFDAELTGLTSDLVYYVRAWAKNGAEQVSYGNPIPFATRYDYYGLRDGKSRHAFTVRNDGTQVYFSMGNLQYKGSTNTWRFAEYQFEFVGDDYDGLVYEGGVRSNNALIAEDYSGWIDLFGWGTSGINDYSPIANCYQPWSTSNDHIDYKPYGSNETNLNSESGKADWGYNAISNGGNTQNSGWRTLQGYAIGDNTAEWNYVFMSRSCTYRYAFVRLNSVRRTASTSGFAMNGVVLFPDDYVWPSLVKTIGTNYNVPFDNYNPNQLTEAEWSLLEQAGAIYLPAAGYRSGTGVYEYDGGASYWSTTRSGSYAAHRLRFSSYTLLTANSYNRNDGCSVRLVRLAE